MIPLVLNLAARELAGPAIRRCSGEHKHLSRKKSMRLKLLFAVAVIFILTGMLIDGSYQRSTPDAAYARGIVVGFDRPHAR
jgi:hypothetical protein